MARRSRARARKRAARGETLARTRGAERTVSPRAHSSEISTRVRVVVDDDARVATTNSRRDEDSHARAKVRTRARV